MDRRRFGVIEVRRVNAGTYHLTIIGGQMWSEVEWSPSRRRWCIQDAAGQCLAHVESIVGMDKDPQAAIRLAKRMIVAGRMPTPEEARRQLAERTKAKAKPQAGRPVIRSHSTWRNERRRFLASRLCKRYKMRCDNVRGINKRNALRQYEISNRTAER